MLVTLQKRFIYWKKGFDDRVIEILKLKVYIYLKKQQRYPNTLRYKDRDKQSETIWFSYTENDQEDVLALTWESYLQVKQRMPEEVPKNFMKSISDGRYNTLKILHKQTSVF